MALAIEIELEVIICGLRRLSVIFGTIAAERDSYAPFSGHTHSSCLESLYLLSLYDELSAAVDGGVGGAEINDSREPEFLRAANGKEPK